MFVPINLFHIDASQSRAGLLSASTGKYQTPRTRIKFGEISFSYAGPTAWNSLPQHIREITDTMRFKRHLKTVLFQRRFWTFRLFLDLDLYRTCFYVFTRLLSAGHFYVSVLL